VAPLPIATFWQTPYFCVKLAALSPPTDFRSTSESDFLLLVERAEDLRESLGAEVMRSLRVNFCPPSKLAVDGVLDRLVGVEGGFSDGKGLPF
jgi:hypothetical protein